MEHKTRTKALSWLLSLAMVLSLLPGMSIPALAEETTGKTIAGLGTSAIGNPTSTTAEATAWAGSYVYYGKYDGTNPTKYRVLDKASDDFGVEGGSLLLDCDTVLYKDQFDSSNSKEWSKSSLRTGLNGAKFLTKSGNFTEQEKAAIASSTKAEKSANDGPGQKNYNFVSLSSEKVFILDAAELTRTSYGYPSEYSNNGTRKKGSVYWQRSFLGGEINGANNACCVTVQGAFTKSSPSPAMIPKDNVSPAFNVSLSSVIFSSEISGESGSYKLTLKDDALGIAVTSGKKANLNNNQLTIPYTVSGDNSANATQVSVLVTDKAYTESNAQILEYGKLANVTSDSLSGRANFTLPDNLTGTLGTDYHIYLLAEDVNGEKETDYAGLKEITADDVTAHEHSFTYTASGATITAKCGASGCELDDGNGNHTATLTIAAPLHTAVGDGKSADAQITDENQLKGSATVSYYKANDDNTQGDALDSAPTGEGKYWTEITLGTATAHVVYEITNPEYNITLPTDLVGGTVAAAISQTDVTKAHYNDTVTLTVTPETGFTLKSLTVKDSENNAVVLSDTSNTRTFTMPASNVTVSVTFEGAPFDVTISNAITGGTVVVSSGLENGQAKAGTEVTLTVTPATGFSFVNFEVKTASDKDITVTNGKFTMPTEAVTVSATFEGKSTTATLDVTGDKGPNCTAKLLHDDFTDVTNDAPLTKKGGEQFILLVNRDEGYDFAVTYGTNSPVTLTEFTEDQYKAYVAYAKDKNLPVSSSMILAWATMPGVAGENVTLTVKFSKLQTFTILYQPSEENTTAAWCKFAYTEASSLVTDSAQMHNDTVMGDGTKVYSLKVTAAFNPAKVAFVTDASNLESATMGNATVSQNTDSWNDDITGGKYVVIGGNAKTVVAAFVTDANSIKVYNGNSNREDMGKTTTATDGVTYRLAIVTESGDTVTPGAVKAPAAPENSDDTIQFAGWWGFEYDGDGKEKVYKAGENVPVSKNTTFIDRWEPKQLTVKLNLNGGTGVTTNHTVAYGETMQKPTDPTRYSFAFEGWRVNKTVTEGGQLFVKGTPFVDFGNTKITADMGLTAQWKHVHTYTCYRISTFGDALAAYAEYDSAIHVAVCGCNDIQLMAHEFDENGKCACGYEKPGPKPVKLEVSYVRFENSTYTTRFKGLPQPMKPNRGEEVTISAPNGLDEDYWFTKWQFSTDNGETWSDLAAAEEVSFIIPCDMLVRALYVNGTTKPQVELSASKYKQDVEVKGYTFKADNILFQMHYKLPDGYTFVDAGVRVGDNDGIVYYELKEKTHEASTGGKVASWVGATFLSFFTGGPEIPETSATERYYEVRKSNAVADMGAAKVAKYMYESEPVSAKAAPILYEAKATTKGSSGSVATIPPIGLAQAENQNNWIYGIGWLRYKTPQGKVETIYTDALAATLKNMPTNTVTKQGS